MINSLSGLISIPIAVFIGHFIESSMMPIAVGFSLCSATSLLVIYIGKKFGGRRNNWGQSKIKLTLNNWGQSKIKLTL